MNKHKTHQLTIVHLSDLHFGEHHRFQPKATPSGDIPIEKEFPSLLDNLQKDLAGEDPGCPIILCITGDLVQTGSLREFNDAERFVRGLAVSTILGQQPGLNNIFFVPGNHDVQFDSDDVGTRWQQWVEFHNRIREARIRREEPRQLVELHNRTADLGALILSLNSAVNVRRGSQDEKRGQVDDQQLKRVQELLEEIPPATLKSSIRIALIHHHPVLVPSLTEPGRGYDAIIGADKLLIRLRKYGFHLLLHGHKHNPQLFSDDVKPAFSDSPFQPLLIAAGGSVGSTELPDLPKKRNCYNLIRIKWHPEAGQVRINVETRGLEMYDSENNEKLPVDWNWNTLKQYDTTFLAGERAPKPRTTHPRKFGTEVDKERDAIRTQQYQDMRGNLPVVEVMPSLRPNQAYSARLWIVHHEFGLVSDQIYPVEVTWSAGKMFPVVSILRTEDPRFCVEYDYWEAMLVQARLTFEDGHTACAQVYARIPTDYGPSP